MERIVQLSEYEYNRLREQADATRDAINKAVDEKVKEVCNIEVELKLDIGREWNETFRIKPYASIHGGWVENRCILDPDVAWSSAKRIQKWMKKQIEERYGFGIEQVNRYTRANENRWKWNTFFLILSVSGWVVALLTWILR